MVDLVSIFNSKAQVKLLQFLLDNPNKIVTQNFIAKLLNLSPSTIARVIQPLEKENIIKIEEVKKMKVITLNTENEITKILIEFNSKIKNIKK
ncbi:MAG: winged helix-turn-helix domain-containing protein [Nitrososphaerota archaeon]